MIRHTALLSALTISLLLGACSKDNGDAARQAAAEAQATEAQADADAQEDAPPETWTPMDYWPVVGPFVAGSYSGTCLDKKNAKPMNGSASVATSGKVGFNGADIRLDIDFRGSQRVNLSRNLDSSGVRKSSAWFSMRPEEDGGMMLHSGEAGKGILQLSRGDVELMCMDIAGSDKLVAQPLNVALASLLDVKKQTLSCMANMQVQNWRDVDVEIGGGMIKVGDESFDTRTATMEAMMSDDAGENVSVLIGMPGAHLQMKYHGAGKLADLSINREGNSLSCQQKL